MFESFNNRVKNKETPKTESMSFFNNPILNSTLLREKLYHIDALSERELFNLVKDSFDLVLKQIFSNKDQDYLKIITNTKFLIALNQVVLNLDLTYTQRIYCNKLAYDYFTSENNDPYTKQLFFALSKSVNRNIIGVLCSIGLPEDLASYLALARYSSEKEMINVKRLNFIIISSSVEIMTEQMIIKIYEKLFDSITPLFEGIMFDGLDMDEEYVSESMNLIYSTISLAILVILNNMPSQDIRKVLISYQGDYEALYQNSKPRFQVSAISEDYIRILDVIEALKEEKIFIY